MKRFNLLRSISSGLILASTLFATGCDGGDEGEEPRQYVDENVTQEEFEIIITAAELNDAMGVADFLVYKVDDSRDDYNLLSSQCTADPEDYFENSCGGCVCLTDGSVLCVDYSCDDIFGSITFPGEPADSNSGLGDFSEPPTPRDPIVGGPGTDFGDLQSPRPPANPMGDGANGPGSDFDTLEVVELKTFPADDSVDGPGTDFDSLTPPPMADDEDDMILDQYTESPAFCRDGHAVGAVWDEGPNSCICTEDRIVACTLIGDPISPDSLG